MNKVKCPKCKMKIYVLKDGTLSTHGSLAIGRCEMSGSKVKAR